MEILAKGMPGLGKVRRHLAPWSSIWLLLIFSCTTAGAQQPLEADIKAAYLLNFTKFVEWPAGVLGDEPSPLLICVLGDSPVESSLGRIVEGEVVNGKKLVVRKIKRGAAVDGCRVLFIPQSEKDAPKLLGGLGPGILSVGEGDNFLREGGMIGFVVENRRVRFDINQAATANAKLLVSARLLNVARSVESKPQANR